MIDTGNIFLDIFIAFFVAHGITLGFWIGGAAVICGIAYLICRLTGKEW